MTYLERIAAIKPQVRDTFAFFIAMIAAFDFPTSVRYNALYGPLALCGLLASMAFTRSCGNTAAKLLALRASDMVRVADIGSLHLPTPQWALKTFAALDHDRTEAACGAAFHVCTAVARERGMIPARPVGMIDGHRSAYYGKNGDESFTVKSRSKDGTTTFDMFVTSAIRAGPYPLHTAMRRMRRGAPMADYVKDILAQNQESGIACSHWLVDRQFFSVAVMSAFGNANECFLMFARMTPGVKEAFAEYLDGRRAAMSEYTVKSGRAKFVGTLAFVRKRKTKRDGTVEDVVLPFFSNLPRHLLEEAIRGLPIELKKRWMHETSLRVANLSKLMTASNSPSIRTCFFAMSLIIENLWVMTNHMVEIQRRAKEGLSPHQQPPADDELGDARCLASKTRYNLSSKEFLSLIVSEAAKLLTMDKRSQDEYTKAAVDENRRRILPMIQKRPMVTGADAFGLPRWG